MYLLIMSKQLHYCEANIFFCCDCILSDDDVGYGDGFVIHALIKIQHKIKLSLDNRKNCKVFFLFSSKWLLFNILKCPSSDVFWTNKCISSMGSLNIYSNRAILTNDKRINNMTCNCDSTSAAAISKKELKQAIKVRKRQCFKTLI